VYQIKYADIQAESPVSAKEREREILQRSIDLLERGRAEGVRSIAMIEAVHFTSRVWTAFLEDLARDDNQLPKEARASLISIGIWVLKELDAVRDGSTDNFADLIEISQIIRDGLQ